MCFHSVSDLLLMKVAFIPPSLKHCREAGNSFASIFCTLLRTTTSHLSMIWRIFCVTPFQTNNRYRYCWFRQYSTFRAACWGTNKMPFRYRVGSWKPMLRSLKHEGTRLHWDYGGFTSIWVRIQNNVCTHVTFRSRFLEWWTQSKELENPFWRRSK